MTMEAGTSSADTGGGNTGTGDGGGGPSVADAIGNGRAREVGSDASEAADKTRAKGKDGKDAPTAAEVARYKALVGGQEVEHDGPTLAKMLSDDYEHEFTGPGGKPWKGSRAEIERMVQKGLGYEVKNRALAEREQRFQQQLELARKDPKARLAFMMAHLGIEDPDDFVIERYKELDQQRQEHARLIAAGKGDEAFALSQRLAEERLERKKYLENVTGQRQQAQQQQQQAQQQHQGKVRAALEKLGVPFSRETFELAEQIHQKWAELDIPKTYAQIADEVAKQHRDGFHKLLRGIPREKLLTELPNDWRRQLRELEADAAKAIKKDERVQAKPEPTERETQKLDGISEAEYARRQKQARS